MYGHKWVSIYPDSDVLIEAETEWGRALAGISLDDIKRGLDRCVDEYPSWPPTIGEFKQLCLPDPGELGLPNIGTVLKEICSSRLREFGAPPKPYSHGLILAIIQDDRCDARIWGQLPAVQAEKKLEPIYREYIKRATAGEKFELPEALEHKPQKPISREERVSTASRYLGGLKDALNGGGDD